MLKFMKNKSEFLKIGTIKSLEMGKTNLSLVSNSKIQKKGIMTIYWKDNGILKYRVTETQVS